MKKYNINQFAEYSNKHWKFSRDLIDITIVNNSCNSSYSTYFSLIKAKWDMLDIKSKQKFHTQAN